LLEWMDGFCWYFGGNTACMQASFSYNTSSEILLARVAAYSHTSGERLDKNQPCQHFENSEKQLNSYSFSTRTLSRLSCRRFCSSFLVLSHFGQTLLPSLQTCYQRFSTATPRLLLAESAQLFTVHQ
jgi:hypothetical protein